jgi:hypothetical protein
VAAGDPFSELPGSGGEQIEVVVVMADLRTSGSCSCREGQVSDLGAALPALLGGHVLHSHGHGHSHSHSHGHGHGAVEDRLIRGGVRPGGSSLSHGTMRCRTD